MSASKSFTAQGLARAIERAVWEVTTAELGVLSALELAQRRGLGTISEQLAWRELELEVDWWVATACDGGLAPDGGWQARLVREVESRWAGVRPASLEGVQRLREVLIPSLHRLRDSIGVVRA
jgi:hypothetical protein